MSTFINVNFYAINKDLGPEEAIQFIKFDTVVVSEARSKAQADLGLLQHPR